MKNWTEFRTAFFVAETGSVSAAAKALGVHRATVLRHLDVLEQELNTKVFLRDNRGYQLTEVGEDLLRVAKLTEEQLQAFSRRSQGRSQALSGELIVTSLDGLSTLLAPAINRFRQAHPRVCSRYLTSEQLIKLEYGQAHLAIRSGPKPQIDNYVVLPFRNVRIALFASDDYLSRFGIPQQDDSLRSHQFVGLEGVPERMVMQQWFLNNVSAEQLSVITNSQHAMQQAIADGCGIGFAMLHEVARFPNLKQVLPDVYWDAPNWILTHGDLHRSDKVQAFLSILKSESYQAELESILNKAVPVAVG